MFLPPPFPPKKRQIIKLQARNCLPNHFNTRGRCGSVALQLDARWAWSGDCLGVREKGATQVLPSAVMVIF